MRTSEVPGQLYDGLKNAKKIDLVEEGEDSRPTYIATDLTLEEACLHGPTET